MFLFFRDKLPNHGASREEHRFNGCRCHGYMCFNWMHISHKEHTDSKISVFKLIYRGYTVSVNIKHAAWLFVSLGRRQSVTETCLVLFSEKAHRLCLFCTALKKITSLMCYNYRCTGFV